MAWRRASQRRRCGGAEAGTAAGVPFIRLVVQCDERLAVGRLRDGVCLHFFLALVSFSSGIMELQKLARQQVYCLMVAFSLHLATSSCTA
jgi:hypothetical protein